MEQQTSQLNEQVQVFEKQSLMSKLGILKSSPLLIAAVLVILVGVGSGYLLSQTGQERGGKAAVAPGAKVTKSEAGLDDIKTFRDQATGVLKLGGIDGEGTHHLERDGGPSQNVYLTSSIINLGDFVDKKVEVWGETFQGQKAGWLMDVGKIKVVD